LITSRQIIQVSETYVTAKKVPDGYLQVFSNPTSTELSSITKDKKEIRFIADSKAKKVYVFDSYLATHENVSDLINLRRDDFDLFFGYAKVSGGKATFDRSHDFKIVLNNVSRNDTYGDHARNFLKIFFNKDQKWEWLDRYISGSLAFIRTCKSQYLDGLKKIEK